MIRLAIALSLVAGVALGQESAGLSLERSADNVAALFTMTDEGGRLRNLELMQSVFKDGTLGFRSETHHNVSSTYIYSRLEKLASELEGGGTLLVYLNSHGGGSGDRFIMTAKGGNFKFSKALEAMKKAGRPVRRLILLVDTCHAEGSIQDSTGGDGELLRNLKSAKPTTFLPEMPSSYLGEKLPFISPFVNMVATDERIKRGPRAGEAVMVPVVDYGESSGVWDELLIISSSSVEDLSVRGVFAGRLASTFQSVKGEKGVTVGEFLRRFAASHGSGGQQPHYKVLPDSSMFDEPLFGPWYAQTIPILDYGTRNPSECFVPVPTK